MSQILRDFTNQYTKDSVPELEAGQIVKVHQKIREGEKTRIQIFQGTIIAVNPGHGVNSTFTVRKMSYGVGVERIFPLHSPRVEKTDVVRRGRVRRAKLYYIRDRVGKAAKVPELIRRKDQHKKASN